MNFVRKNMKKYLLLLILLFNVESLFPHCQVPCGIYDDAMRIMFIQEDFETIKKAITAIDNLSKKNDPQSLNQLNRWVMAKDEHASNIQKLVSDYFLTQRIKKTNGQYVNQLKYLHQILVHAMKCKQGVSQQSVKNGLKFLDEFSKVYFDKHGLDHLRSLK